MATTKSGADRTGVVISAIINELAKLGHPAMRANYKHRDDPCIEFDDGIQVEVAVQQRGEKHRLIVGSYVDDPGRKNFPEPKGGFRVGEAAVLVWQLAEARRAVKAAEDREWKASKAASGINKALGIGDGSVSAATNGKGGLTLDARAPGTAEQITAMRLAIELGLVKSSKPGLTRRAPMHDESPSLRAKIGAAIGVEAKRVLLWWVEPFLRCIELGAGDDGSPARGLTAPEIIALRNVGLVPGESGWELMEASPARPAPMPNDGPEIWPLLIAEVTAGHYGGDTPAKRHLLDDMRARDAVGRERYGVPLQPHNGRPALEDAYDEALDGCAYLRQAQEEGILPEHNGLVDHAITLAFGLRKRLDALAKRVAEKGEL